MLVKQYFETDCRYAFVLAIFRHFQRQNRGNNSRWSAASVVEITWRPAGADLGCLNIGQLQKIIKTIMTDQYGASFNKLIRH
jgi:hypothetical protein